jgi:hypothetical protein
LRAKKNAWTSISNHPVFKNTSFFTPGQGYLCDNHGGYEFRHGALGFYRQLSDSIQRHDLNRLTPWHVLHGADQM